MKFSTKTGALRSHRGDCAAVTVEQAESLASGKNEKSNLALQLEDFPNKPGDTRLVRMTKGAAFEQLLVVGTGADDLSAAEFRKLADNAAKQLTGLKARSAVVALDALAVEGRDTYWKVVTLATALAQHSYRFHAYKTKDTTAVSLKAATFLATQRNRNAVSRAVVHGRALAAGLTLARDLGNQPPNVCNPTYLAREARKFGKDPKTTVTVLDEKRLKELGMGAFVAVSQGSTTPGKLIIIHYKGGKRTDAPVALVGKGITFDTGGISIKPAPAMDEMKFDMCGAAGVLGVTAAVIDAKLPINLVTAVAAAENMPSGDATRPGDIVTTLSGQTVEILNTDAEGRLVLCDAITYIRRFKPKAIIDVATLTGACIVALGSVASGVMANDDALATALVEAGDQTGDRAWQLPLFDDYQNQLKSPFADFANIGGREAGAITAGCFLSRFTEGVPWAHMDVAGSAFRGGANKGATGRPVPLLFNYLTELAGA